MAVIASALAADSDACAAGYSGCGALRSDVNVVP